MKKFIVLPLIGLLAGQTYSEPISPSAQHNQQTNSPLYRASENEKVIPGQIIVRYKKGLTESQKIRLVEPVATKVEPVRKSIRGSASQRSVGRPSVIDDISVLTLKKDLNLQEAIEDCERNPDILYAEPNYVWSINETFPDDPDFSLLWGLHNTGQDGGQADADVDAPQAWDTTTGSHEIVVAVIDTGVDYNHEDLADNMWVNEAEQNGLPDVDDDGNGYVDDIYGFNFVNSRGDPFDDHRHGTHVSGTIGAVGNNGIGVAGVNWNVRIMAIKFLNAAGSGSTFGAIRSFEYAIANNARVINNSWGGGPYSQALHEVIEEAHENGILVVASAGNLSPFFAPGPSYPQSYNHVMSIGAIDRNRDLANFSNYGAFVDISGPGVDVFSTVPGNRYDSFSGTSMSAPHVSGVAALILSHRPELTSEELASLLKSNVEPLMLSRNIGGLVDASMAISDQRAPLVSSVHFPDMVIYHEQPTVSLTGSAYGENFLSYSLEVGKGWDPTEWTEFYSSQQPIRKGILFENFDGNIPGMNNGWNAIRLVVRGSDGRVSEDRQIFFFESVTARLQSFFNANQNRFVDVRGVARGANFSSYALAYGIGSNPTDWTEILSSNEPVLQATSLLGNERFDLSIFPEGLSWFRLDVNGREGEVETVFQSVEVDMIQSGLEDISRYSHGGLYTIHGTAKGTEFSRYRLLFGESSAPDEWVQFFESNEPVDDGNLMENFDPAMFPIGNFNWIRLIVEDEFGRTEESSDLVSIAASHAEITSPGEFVRGLPTDVIGTAVSANFAFYTFEHHPDTHLAPDHTWTELLRFHEPVTQGVLVPDFLPGELADGGNGFRIVVHDQDGDRTIRARNIPVVTPNPISEFDMPDRIYADGDTFDITGTATGYDFKEYRVSVFNNETREWDLLFTSDQPVDGDVLAQVSVNQLELGQRHQFELAVENQIGGMSYDYHWAFIEQIAITHPQNNDFIRKGDLVSIEGTIGIPFRNYRIEYGFGPNPTKWMRRGIRKTVRGPRDSYQGVLAHWRTRRVRSVPNDPHNGSLQLRLIVKPKNGGERIVRLAEQIRLDPQLKRGWPQAVEFSDPSGEVMGRNMTVDLDKDGIKEILVMAEDPWTQPFEQRVRLLVYRANGELWWEKRFYGKEFADRLNTVPVVGDFDEDGWNEIVMADVDPASPKNNQVHVLNHDGSVAGSPWPLQVSGNYSNLILADMDQDGTLELLVKNLLKEGGSTDPGFIQIHIIENDGRSVNTIQMINEGFIGIRVPEFPAVGNFDDDEDLEIVARIGIESIGVYNVDGSLVTGWPQNVGSIFNRSLVVGDVDGDGKEDIVTASGILGNDAASIRVYNRDGTLLPGWEDIGTNLLTGNITFLRNPVLVDFNQDGKLEIIVAGDRPQQFVPSTEFSIFAFDYQGQLLTGWPKEIHTFQQITIGDVDGDDESDVVILLAPEIYGGPYFERGDPTSNRILAFRSNGSEINLNPSWESSGLFFEAENTSGDSWVSLDDIDADGRLDLVATSNFNTSWIYNEDLDRLDISHYKKRGSISVWGLDVAYNSVTMQWPTMQHDLQHTGRFQPKEPDPVLVVEAGVDQTLQLKRVGDGRIDGDDFLILQAHFNTRRGEPLYYPPADINQDGFIDSADVGLWIHYQGTRNPKADINYPSLTKLMGSVMINGESPAPELIEVQWELDMGPAPITIFRPHDQRTRVVFMKDGTYFIKLRATYQGLEMVDQVKVVVDPKIEPPSPPSHDQRRGEDFFDSSPIHGPAVYYKGGQYEVSFIVPSPSLVSAALYDQRGRKSKTLFSEFLKPGIYVRNFTHQTKSLSPGLHHLVLKIGNEVHKLKVVIFN